MSIETIYRAVIQSIVESHNYRRFSTTIKTKFKFILDYIDKWNPELVKHKCSVATKVYQFYHNDKHFSKCHNPSCSRLFFDVATFKIGYPVCCSMSCRNEYYKQSMTGEHNPNFGHKWSEEKRQIASANTTKQMQNPYYRYVANQPKTEEARISKSNKISKARKELFKNHPELRKSHWQWTDEQRKNASIKSKQRFTPEFNKRFRQTMEQRGHWIPNEDKSDYQIYYQESNWVCKMFDLITDAVQLNMLKQLGVFNPFKNSKGVVRDHIYSRHSGFIEGVFPEIMRHPCNCQLLTHSENVKKKGGQYIDRDDQTLQ